MGTWKLDTHLDVATDRW